MGHSEEQWRVTALGAGEVKYLPLAWQSQDHDCDGVSCVTRDGGCDAVSRDTFL